MVHVGSRSSVSSRRVRSWRGVALSLMVLMGACTTSDSGEDQRPAEDQPSTTAAEPSDDVSADDAPVGATGDDAAAGQPERTVSEDAAITFSLGVIDADPPPGDGCCIDVIAPGDVDGDGDGDVIVGAENADGLVWYRNPGGSSPSGDWERFVMGAGNFTTDGYAVDLDADGDLDMVVSAIDRNVVEWWEQTADPTSSDGWQRHDIGPDFAHDLMVADVNLDGRVDVGAFHNDAGRVEWFEQPDDLAATWIQHVVDERFGEGIAAGDLDGDGDVDLAAGPAVYLNEDGAGIEWVRVPLADDLPDQTRPRIGDIDGDGNLDVVLAADETEGRLSWFKGPAWAETVIDDDAGFTHSLEIGDIDVDGHLDLLAGVMHTADDPTVRVLFGDGGATWDELVLSTTGTHNARLHDLDGDGYLDVVGKNYDGPKAIEAWWAAVAAPEPADVRSGAAPTRPEGTSGAASPLDGFAYVEIDAARETFNDETAFFGVTFTDIDGDGDDDIASGSYVYLNPGGDMASAWGRIDLAQQLGTVVDVMLAPDVDGDANADLIATALPDVWWLETSDGGSTWDGRVVTHVPGTSRPNGQGYRLGDLNGDGRPEIVLSGGPGESEVWYVEIPDSGADTADWRATRVTQTATDEQIGIGDIDGDGLADIAAGDMKDGGSFIAWFRNPGDGSSDWTRHRLGGFPGVYPDRLDVADLDNDGRLDVVVTEENDGSEPNAEVMWYRQPEDPTSDDWERNVIVRQYTTNGLDVADFDGDGDLDLATGEHRGPLQVAVWENTGVSGDGTVGWVEHPVDTGKESHLGARAWDLDHDGDLDIVSITFDDPQFLHLWVNV